MAKSIAAYRRRVEQLAGPHAKVRAWRTAEAESINYHLGCAHCSASRTGGFFQVLSDWWPEHLSRCHDITAPALPIAPERATYDNQGSTTLNIHTPTPTPTPALDAITAPTTHL